VDGDLVARAAARTSRVLSAPLAPMPAARSGARTLMLAVLNTVPRFSKGGCTPSLQVWRGPDMLACVRADKYVSGCSSFFLRLCP
jgi:hypothetical protein